MGQMKRQMREHDRPETKGNLGIVCEMDGYVKVQGWRAALDEVTHRAYYSTTATFPHLHERPSERFQVENRYEQHPRGLGHGRGATHPSRSRVRR